MNPAIARVRLAKRTMALTMPLTSALQFVTAKLRSQTFDIDLDFTTAISKTTFYDRNLAADLTLAPSVLKKMSKTIAALLSLNPASSPQSFRRQTISASLTFTANLARELFRSLAFSVGLTNTASLTKKGISYKRMDSTLVLSPIHTKRLFFTLNTGTIFIPDLQANPIRAHITFPATVTLFTDDVWTKKNTMAVVMNFNPVMRDEILKRFVVPLHVGQFMNRTVPQRLFAVLTMVPFEHDQLTEPKWFFEAVIAMDVEMIVDPQVVHRTLLHSVLLNAYLGDAHLLSAELKGN
jgi:hypothetical protein